jgi:hypothetical protein
LCSIFVALERATMHIPSFAGSEKCTLCPAGTYSNSSGNTIRIAVSFHLLGVDQRDKQVLHFLVHNVLVYIVNNRWRKLPPICTYIFK